MIGASAGGVKALQKLLSLISPSANVCLVLVMHRLKNVRSSLDSLLQTNSTIPVQEVWDKLTLRKGNAYLAPANYHLLMERDGRVSLNSDEAIHYSRPSIDTTLFSLAASFPKQAVGVILTGANEDGARGLRQLEKLGGTCWIQDPEEADTSIMPEAAAAYTNQAEVLTISEIAKRINQL